MGKKGGKKGGTKGKKSKGGVDPEVQRVALARIGWGESTAPFQSLHDLSLITERAMSVNQTNTVHQAAGGLYPLLNSRPHPSKLRCRHPRILIYMAVASRPVSAWTVCTPFRAFCMSSRPSSDQLSCHGGPSGAMPRHQQVRPLHDLSNGDRRAAAGD